MKGIPAYQKFYALLIFACFAGWGWLIIQNHPLSATGTRTVCLFKKISGIPCPSCGVTRSINLIMEGQPEKGLATNPLGFLMLCGLLVVPLWIGLDAIRDKTGLFDAWIKLEKLITQKKFAIPLMALVVINWIWNIIKGL